MTTRQEIPLHIEVALTIILEYLYAEEQRHYDESGETGHVFNSLRTIAEWLGVGAVMPPRPPGRFSLAIPAVAVQENDYGPRSRNGKNRTLTRFLPFWLEKQPHGQQETGHFS